MTKIPEDEQTPEQIAKKALAYSALLEEATDGLKEGRRLPATKMREMRLFLKRHGATLANPDFKEGKPWPPMT